MPSASTSLEKTIGSGKSIIIELKVRFHGFLTNSLDRSKQIRKVSDFPAVILNEVKDLT
jgi:hypothetical protein